MKIQITADVSKDVAKVLRSEIRKAFQNQVGSYERNSAYGISDLFQRNNDYPRGVVAKISEYNEGENAVVIWNVQISETAGSFRTIYHDARYGLHFDSFEWERAQW